jgi:N-methylhydantoinase A
MDRRFQIGCDIGGTFTDIAVIDSFGRRFADKADTTHANLADGVVQALENVAATVGSTLPQLLGATTRFVNGTTIVTNALAELRGARVALLTTKGHGDVLRIARSARNMHRDHHLQRNLPQVVTRDRIVEVDERIDKAGDVVVTLSDHELVRVVGRVAALEVDAVAISLLWSFVNPAHETLLAQRISQRLPNVFISVSSQLHPVMREYERTLTTVLNSFTGLDIARYTQSVQGRLSELGLRVPISFMQAFGGTVSAEHAQRRPITLVDSGPAGGVVGAARLGHRVGVRDVLACDMGGTSFDVSVAPGGVPTVTQRAVLGGLFLTGVSKIEVHPAAAGGGSIGWVDQRGIPRVGPQSAGSDPGPACYRNGGTRPTVTDAAVALGIVDPNGFLGGRRKLDAAAARCAIRNGLESVFGEDVTAAAAAMYRLVLAEMSSAVRTITVQRGRDPRDFTCVAFGGALGVLAADLARSLNIRDVVIPADAAVFSACGLLDTDEVRTEARSCVWAGGPADEVSTTLLALEAQARRSIDMLEFRDEDIDVEWFGDFKFAGQMWELTVPIPRGEDLAENLAEIAADFPRFFEAEYGPGTAWVGSPVMMLTARVVVRGRTVKFEPAQLPCAAEPGAAPSGSRPVWALASGTQIETAVYAAEALSPGVVVNGPAVVEHQFTTIAVPVDFSLTVDPHGNFRLCDHSGATVKES